MPAKHWKKLSIRRLKRSPRAGMLCKACARRRWRRMTLPWPFERLGKNWLPLKTTRRPPHFRWSWKDSPRICIRFCGDEVYQLAAEALRNAFRHAAAQAIEVEIRYDERYFRLRVRDDGKGIRPDVLRADGRERHYGLHGMRERAKLAGGKLTIWSEVDTGTEIELNHSSSASVRETDAHVSGTSGSAPRQRST